MITGNRLVLVRGWTLVWRSTCQRVLQEVGIASVEVGEAGFQDLERFLYWSLVLHFSGLVRLGCVEYSAQHLLSLMHWKVILLKLMLDVVPLAG